jgi:hypothetical protein
MAATVNRRDFIVSAATIAGAAALPARVYAQASSVNAKGAQILEIARREVAKADAYLWRRDIAGIADFGVHSATRRFHFANLESGTVTSYRVAHGLGSDPEHDGWLKSFSNVPGSNATARGSYITWEWYTGKYGRSVRLGSLEPDNSNTFDRAIVMHSADYCTQAHLDRWGRLGRSNGCFALSPADFQQALAQLSGGRLLFADRLGLI